jgi:hypothetical protein
VTSILAFILAAFAEIAGCFAFWAWLRRGASPLIALVGIGSLIGFAMTLTRVDTMFAGRAYAAYGGIYIARHSSGYGSSRANDRARRTSSAPRSPSAVRCSSSARLPKRRSA